MSKRESLALRERYNELCGEVTVTQAEKVTKAPKRKAAKPKAERLCMQCLKPLPPGASPREQWCESGCYKAWYLARNPDYVPMAVKKLKLISPYDDTFKEVSDAA